MWVFFHDNIAGGVTLGTKEKMIGIEYRKK